MGIYCKYLPLKIFYVQKLGELDHFVFFTEERKTREQENVDLVGAKNFSILLFYGIYHSSVSSLKITHGRNPH